MPRGKADQNPDENSTSELDTGKMNKMKAVRLALGALGFDAKPPALDDYIQKHYNLTVEHNMISSYKSQIKGEAKKQGKRRGRPPASESGSKDNGGNVSMKDLQEVKSLAGRLGVDKLRKLVDVLS